MEKPVTKLMNRNFVLLWAGQAVSALGSRAFTFSMMLWLMEVSDSGTLMGLIMVASSLPAILLGPIGGTFADRFSRRRILIVTDTINGIAVISAAAVIFFHREAPALAIAWLFVVAALGGILGAFFRPATNAAIPDLVPQDKLAAGNALNQFSKQAADMLGQLVGPIAFRLLGAPWLFLLNGLSFLASAGSETFIEIPQKIAPREEGRHRFRAFLDSTKEGMIYVWKDRGLRALFSGVAAMNFFMAPFIILVPFYVDHVLKVRVDWFGFLMAAMAIGSIAGLAVAGTVKITPGRRRRMLLAALFLSALTLCGLAAVGSAPLALVLFFVFGCAVAFFNVHVLTILQASVESEIRGRVLGLLETLSRSLAPIGMAVFGVVIDLLDKNVPRLFLLIGGLLLVISAVLALHREFRRFLEQAPEVQPAAG